MSNEQKLIEGCLAHKRKAQKCLYEKYAPEMMTVCLRYCGDQSTARDTMNEGFLKVFKNISQLKDAKKIKPWIKQIMVNTALMKLRKKDALVFYDGDSLDHLQTIEVFEDDTYQYSEQDLKQIFAEMPKGYKVIFNMYVFDDFSHKDIAQLLHISENTSKSQLSRARSFLRNKLSDIKMEYYAKPKTYSLIGSLLWIYNQII